MNVRNKCEECSGNIVKKQVEFKLYGESLGLFPAEVCIKCGEEVYVCQENKHKISVEIT